MRLFKCCAAAAVAVLYLAATETTAAEFSFVSLDPPGFGMNDPTPRSPVGGNPGTTLGNQRLFALQEAGRIWGRFLHSEVPIRVDVEFASLGRSPGGTPLATAGAEDYESNFLNAPSDDVFYPVALANSLAGFDLEPSRSDIAVTINESLDSSPLPGGWYYGFDDNTPPDQTNFIDVVLHELGHGLGFATITDDATGAFPFGQPDVFATFLRDIEFGADWPQMSESVRAASAKNEPNLVWSGPSTTAAVSGIVQPANATLRVQSPEAIAGNYLFGRADYGPPIPVVGLTGQVVLATDGTGTATDACETILNADQLEGNIALIDRGSCFFDDKTFAAQQAGAIAVIIANNDLDGAIGLGGDGIVDGNPVAITIPSISISQDDGAIFKSALPGLEVTIGEPAGDPIATNNGFLQMHAPAQLQVGSSVSHWSTSAQPDLLMEPFINENLRDDLDLSLTLMRDIGWIVLDIPFPFLSLELWREEQFPPGVNATLNGDPDGDGVSNLEEYFFGGDPLVPDTKQLPVIAAAQGVATIQYTRSSITTDADVTYEISTDLVDWREAIVGVDLSMEQTLPLGSDAESVSVDILQPEPVFLRLRLREQ